MLKLENAGSFATFAMCNFLTQSNDKVKILIEEREYANNSTITNS